MSHGHDVILKNGRVMDPESGHDAVCDLAVQDGRIVAIGAVCGSAAIEIDATGLIVAPGFVDIHGHGQSVAADRMQAFDGVSTSLELEVGALPVADWYERQAKIPRALNYGTSAAWIFARKAKIAGINLDPAAHPVDQMGKGAQDMRWSLDAASATQEAEIVAQVRQGLDEGAIGVGIPNGYAPGAGLKELSRICDLAAEYGRPTFTHIAYKSNIDPNSSVESYVKLIGLAGATGAHMHICHLNSTSLQDIQRAVAVIGRAQAAGLPVTVEAYPYGTGSTVVSAGFFIDPDFTRRTGTGYDAVELVKNHRRFRSRDEIVEARDIDPGDLVLWHYLDVDANEEHRRLLDLSVTYPGGAIASDAMPWVNEDGSFYEGMDWPLPETVVAHPRSSGTFTRFLRQYVRERGLVPLMEGIAKCTLIPAQVIEGCAPAMRRKARLQLGCDADIVVFDLATLADRATFERMNLPAEGVRHLLVNGVALIRDGVLDEMAAPGRAVRAQ